MRIHALGHFAQKAPQYASVAYAQDQFYVFWEDQREYPLTGVYAASPTSVSYVILLASSAAFSAFVASSHFSSSATNLP